MLLRAKGMEKLATTILISGSSKKEGEHELLVCSFNDMKEKDMKEKDMKEALRYNGMNPPEIDPFWSLEKSL